MLGVQVGIVVDAPFPADPVGAGLACRRRDENGREVLAHGGSPEECSCRFAGRLQFAIFRFGRFGQGLHVETAADNLSLRVPEGGDHLPHVHAIAAFHSQADGTVQGVVQSLLFAAEILDAHGAVEHVVVRMDAVGLGQFQDGLIVPVDDRRLEGRGGASILQFLHAQRFPAQPVEVQLATLVDEDQVAIRQREHLGAIETDGRQEGQRLRVFRVAVVELAERGGPNGGPQGIEHQSILERAGLVRRSDGHGHVLASDRAVGLADGRLKLRLRWCLFGRRGGRVRIGRRGLHVGRLLQEDAASPRRLRLPAAVLRAGPRACRAQEPRFHDQPAAQQEIPGHDHDDDVSNAHIPFRM